MGEALLLRGKPSRAEARALDRATFEELYVTYLPKIFRYVHYRVGDRNTAEDITSEVFERALTHLHTYRSDQGRFSTWLFRIAHNLVANHHRTRRRQPDLNLLESWSSIAADHPSPEQTAMNAEQWREVQRCLRQLDERKQEVLALKFGWGLSNQEIARFMKLKPNHVGVLLHRAVRALRLALEEKEAKDGSSEE